MRDEEEVREFYESVEDPERYWSDVELLEEIGVDPTNNPEPHAVIRTLEWVLEKEG